MTLILWSVFGVVLLAGVAGCAYWLRAAMREWGLFEELLVNDRKSK